MKNFRDLQVWQRAHALTLNVYRATRLFPTDERFGLTSQLRRAAVSVPSNLAEGCGRHTDTELARFIDIAMGSASEVEYQLQLARELDYLDEPTYRRLDDATTEVKRMLTALLGRLRADP